MFHKERKYSTRLLCGATATALAMFSSIAHAQESAPIDIAAQPLAKALGEFAAQTKRAVLVTPDLTAARVSRPVNGATDPETALVALLDGTDLTYRQDGDTFLIVKATQDPQSGSVAGAGAEVEALIVTAQKREENIQDVPIAISAFTATDLEEQKIEGGFDLLKAIPNVTFSKNNFSSYNFSIRGIGTKAVSATTDPGVAVSFNNIALLRNRLFEQEYFDIERVEVLRGPQGTLYGRNATGGVINVISAKPDLDQFNGWVKGEVGNYEAERLSAMVNVPLVDEKLAIRLAGALTDRQGYDFNSVTGNPVNGRSLWSTRATIAFEPTSNFRANLVWERFHENDNRSRTGKQLCHRDNPPTMIGNTSLTDPDTPFPDIQAVRAGIFSTGCKAGSLFDEGAFNTPNGLGVTAISALQLLNAIQPTFMGEDGEFLGFLKPIDIYGGVDQSHDLREIASFRDPIYRAKADILQFNFDWDVTPNLTLSSQTTKSRDSVYSFQDFNRFNTLPIFQDSSQYLFFAASDYVGDPDRPGYRDITAGGWFCDPQLGCSNTYGAFDISSETSEQFTQELRLRSSFDGPFNFSVGGSYTKVDLQADYYVMSNILTLLALSYPLNQSGNMTECAFQSFMGPFGALGLGPIRDSSFCPYIDPNPVESIDGEGHNYFRSSNPYKLDSRAVFGEAYWNIQPDLKLTAGLRYTDDRKTFTPVPSQLLLAPGFVSGGNVGTGYPAEPDIKLKWGELTGRIGLDWSPDLGFTDDTMFYAFYSRGYKGGGMNPPSPGFATTQDYIDAGYITPEDVEAFPAGYPILELQNVDYGPTFEPEYVDAFEIGMKNTILGGRGTLNAGAFYYGYKDYQVSQIRDRTAVNQNFDATIYGVELQAEFAVTERLRMIANIGHTRTRIADGEKSIDPINRTLGHPDYMVVKPWIQLPSNCVVPTPVAETWLQSTYGQSAIYNYFSMCQGLGGIVGGFFGTPVTDPVTGAAYDRANYPEINDGAGFYTDLSGNELPNTPHWTANVGAQYGMDFLTDWRVTLRGDAYWQSQSYHRVYNYEPYDKLHGWYNVNLSVWFEKPDADLKIELYAKNLLDKTPITDAFLNSDDTGLTTNVFVLDPRLIGFSIRKGF